MSSAKTYNCRYNKGKGHRYFKTEQELLDHEKNCPDKKKRTDLKECPYNPKHVVLTKQYEKHIKTCKNKPKENPKKEELKVEENIIQKDNQKNNKSEDWDLKVDQWIEEGTADTPEIKDEKNKIIIQKLKTPSNQDVFDDEDFIFKSCYI